MVILKMGCFSSSTAEAPKTVEKASIVEEETIVVKAANFTQQEIKILTLGAGESGKTTFWRHLKIIYFGGFTSGERKAFVNLLRVTIIDDVKKLIDSAETKNQTFASALHRDISTIKDLEPAGDELTPEVAEAIYRVWQDPIMRVVYEQAGSSGIGENASFFLDSVSRIADPNYSPTDEDILKARIRTLGKNEIKFQFGNRNSLLIDVGGQKNERKNWKKNFEDVNYVLFVVSLSDFDQYMY